MKLAEEIPSNEHGLENRIWVWKESKYLQKMQNSEATKMLPGCPPPHAISFLKPYNVYVHSFVYMGVFILHCFVYFDFILLSNTNTPCRIASSQHLGTAYGKDRVKSHPSGILLLVLFNLHNC